MSARQACSSHHIILIVFVKLNQNTNTNTNTNIILIVFVKLNQNDYKYWDGNPVSCHSSETGPETKQWSQLSSKLEESGHVWHIVWSHLRYNWTLIGLQGYNMLHTVILSDTLCVRHTDPRVRSSILKILFWSAPNLFRPKTHRLGCACGRDGCYRHQMWSMEYQTQNTEIQNKHKIQKYKKHCQRHNGPRNWLRDLD